MTIIMISVIQTIVWIAVCALVYGAGRARGRREALRAAKGRAPASITCGKGVSSSVGEAVRRSFEGG